nr:hypothetical protein [Acidiferrimicrobium sp. IK]
MADGPEKAREALASFPRAIADLIYSKARCSGKVVQAADGVALADMPAVLNRLKRAGITGIDWNVRLVRSCEKKLPPGAEKSSQISDQLGVIDNVFNHLCAGYYVKLPHKIMPTV